MQEFVEKHGEEFSMEIQQITEVLPSRPTSPRSETGSDSAENEGEEESEKEEETEEDLS